jgi:hypothetical protein
MTHWARVDEENKIQEVTNIDPAGRFHESLIWRELPAGAENFVTSDFKLLEDGTIEAPLERFKDDFKVNLASVRWIDENNFIMFEDEEVWCGRDTIAMLAEIKNMISAGTLTTVEWKTKSGNYLELDLAKATSLLEAIILHKIKTFQAEKIVRTEIDAKTESTDFFTYNMPARFWEELNNL